MRNPDHWDLIQIVTRQRLDNLSSAEFFQHVNALTGEEQKNWYAWRAGMPDWVCVVQLNQSNASANPTLALETQVIEPVMQALPVATESNLVQAAGGAMDRRKHHRHSVRTKIVVLFNGQTFRAFSKDISVGGLLLLNQIPWKFEDANCTVFVSNPKGGQSLEFTGKVLSDPQDPCRVQFQNPSENFLLTLNQWLEETQLNSMKSAA